jgi:MYXO-CTERM domain-containing protein
MRFRACSSSPRRASRRSAFLFLTRRHNASSQPHASSKGGICWMYASLTPSLPGPGAGRGCGCATDGSAASSTSVLFGLSLLVLVFVLLLPLPVAREPATGRCGGAPPVRTARRLALSSRLSSAASSSTRALSFSRRMRKRA